MVEKGTWVVFLRILLSASNRKQPGAAWGELGVHIHFLICYVLSTCSPAFCVSTWQKTWLLKYLKFLLAYTSSHLVRVFQFSRIGIGPVLGHCPQQNQSFGDNWDRLQGWEERERGPRNLGNRTGFHYGNLCDSVHLNKMVSVWKSCSPYAYHHKPWKKKFPLPCLKINYTVNTSSVRCLIS